MNILICCEFYYPSVGGVEKVAEQLAKNFTLKGHKVSIATSKFNKKLPKLERINRISVNRFAIRGNYVKGIYGKVKEYHDFLLKGNFDVILFYAAQQWTLDAALPVLNKINSNIYLATCGFSGLKKIGYKNYFSILKNKLSYFNRIIVHSNNYIDINYLKKNKIKNHSLIPNAAENIFDKKKFLDFFHSSKIIKAKKNIINVSNFKFNKGQDLSILIFFLLNFKDKINLIFIGDKFNSKVYFFYLYLLKKFTEFFFQNKRIYFLQKINRKKVLSAFFSSDLFLFTSRLECSPLVLFESSASGLPFVSLNAGNAREISNWTKSGKVFNSIFSASFFISYLLSDKKKLINFSKNGIKSFKKKYNWKNISREYLKLFNNYNI